MSIEYMSCMDMVWWYVLCGWQVVCQTNVEPVAVLRAEVVEDGLDLAQRHLLLQVGERGLPSCADGSECACPQRMCSECSCAGRHCMCERWTVEFLCKDF